MSTKYSEGIYGDSAAILCNGQPMTIDQILEKLQQHDELLAAAKQVVTTATALGFTVFKSDTLSRDISLLDMAIAKAVNNDSV